MTIRLRFPIMALAIFPLWAVAPVAAQERPDANRLIDEVAACRSIAEPDARLACYDKAAGSLAEARERRDIMVVDREEVKKAKRSLFGFSMPRLQIFEAMKEDTAHDTSGEARQDGARKAERTGKAEDADDLREITTSIVSVSLAGYGKWTMQLADGSEWTMIEQKADLEPRKGDKIRIERGTFGNYRASIRGRPLVRVKRIG